MSAACNQSPTQIYVRAVVHSSASVAKTLLALSAIGNGIGVVIFGAMTIASEDTEATG
jgi:hypothetical protein